MCRENINPTGFESYFDNTSDVCSEEKEADSKIAPRKESSSTLLTYPDINQTEEDIEVDSVAKSCVESESDPLPAKVLTPNNESLSEIVDNIFVLQKVGKHNNIALRRDVVHK